MEKLTLWRIKLHVIFVSHGFFLRILTLLATFLQMTHKYPARDYREYGSIILSLYFQCAGWDIFWHFPVEGERRWQWPWRLHCQADGRYSNFPHLTSHSLYDLINSYNLQLFQRLQHLKLLQLQQLTAHTAFTNYCSCNSYKFDKSYRSLRTLTSLTTKISYNLKL